MDPLWMFQQTSKSSNLLKLHLGCGEKLIPGFVHIDRNHFDHVDYVKDIADLPMLSEHSVDLIYACHVLEYFHRDEAKDVLAEWYRVLKKGGLLRLAVPDFESIVKVYLKYSDLDHRGILGPLYGKWPNNNDQSMFYHHTVYDFNLLHWVLEEANFNNISRYNWQDTEHANIDDYSQSYIPHMDKENGTLISLNVEAYK